jgi:DNA-directed RNA polymerase specialized sigma subunit
LRLELVSHTTDINAIIATAVLTTTSKSNPTTLFRRLKENPERVARVLSRIEVQHGSILEHNRLCWRLEASDDEVLEILLKHRFLSFTRLDGSSWLVSSNFRTAVRYVQENDDRFSRALMASIPESLATVLDKIGGKSD